MPVLKRPNLPELRAGDDAFDGGGDAALALLEFGGDVLDEGFVGELDAAPEGEAEEFADEMLDEVVAAVGEEVVPDTVEAVEGCAVGEGDSGVDGRPAASVWRKRPMAS